MKKKYLKDTASFLKMWCVLLLDDGGDRCWDAEKIFGPYSDKQDAINLAKRIAKKLSPDPRVCNYKCQVRIFYMHPDLDDKDNPFVSFNDDEDYHWFEGFTP